MTDLATAPATDAATPDAPTATPADDSSTHDAGRNGARPGPGGATSWDQELDELRPVGASTGPRAIWQHRYLLRMLVRKELTVRYSRSTLGYAWSYVKPAVQLGIYFLFIGVLLGLSKRVENFPVYIFAGHTIVQFLTETWNAGTRCIGRNKALIKKVDLPRELFPVASMLVSLAHMGPPLVLLLLAATATGWEPSVLGVTSAILAILLVGTLGLGLGMLCGALNVFLRDVQNIVDIFGMFMRWTAPMLYPWTLVSERFQEAGLPTWVLTVYLWNPICVAVELFHNAFWISTVEQCPPSIVIPTEADACSTISPDLFLRAGVAIGASALFLLLAYAIFNRLQLRFAEEL